MISTAGKKSVVMTDDVLYQQNESTDWLLKPLSKYYHYLIQLLLFIFKKTKDYAIPKFKTKMEVVRPWQTK